MLNTVGSLCGAKATGILDCVTYTAGVSGKATGTGTMTNADSLSPLGSCWALGVIHSGVSGSHLPHDAARHLKDRIQISYLDMETLDALINPPTNKVRSRGALGSRGANGLTVHV